MIKVLTSCGEVIEVKKVFNDELGEYINCPYLDGCNGTCNIEIIEDIKQSDLI